MVIRSMVAACARRGTGRQLEMGIHVSLPVAVPLDIKLFPIQICVCAIFQQDIMVTHI
jgi:hypothetical protein